MNRAANSVKHWTRNHKLIIFPLLSFIIPLIVRSTPEIMVGSSLVGFDTAGFYLPSTLLWLHGGTTVWGFLQSGPLCYSIFMLIVAAGGSIIWALKIIPPLLLGFLGFSIFIFAKRGLSWSSPKSLFVALLGTIYFVALRTSWDQFREEFGLIFFFAFLVLLVGTKNKSWKHYVALSLIMIAGVLSHQLVAVLMFGALIFTIGNDLFLKHFKRSINLIIVSLPSALFFVTFYLTSAIHYGFFNYSTNTGEILASWTGFASYQSMLATDAGFFLYCYLPLLPLVLLSLWRFRNLQLISWLFLSLILLFLPISIVPPYWWVLLLAYPFAFYATDTLSWLKQIKWHRFKITTYKIALLYIVLSTAILSFGFVFMNSKEPFYYFSPSQFNKYPNQIPSSMLQNTLPVSDCQSAVLAFQWFKNNVSNTAILLTHTAFYGWALLTLNQNQVRNYGFGDPATAAMTVAKEGYTQIYVIWWAKDQGWYGQPSLSSAFQVVHQNGEIAIYCYGPSAENGS